MIRFCSALALASLHAAFIGCSDPGSDTPEQSAAQVDVWFEPQETARGIDFLLDTELSDEHWMPEIIVGGGAVLDFDDDGWMDLYLLQAAGSGGNRLLKNRGDGTFDDVTGRSGAGNEGYASGAATGDVDGDGDVDIFVTHLGPDVLLLNNGDGTFSDATRDSGLGDDGWSTSSTFFDADSDGDLDLYVCRYVQWSPETVLPCQGLGTGDRYTRGYCKPSRYPPTTDLMYLNDGRGRFELLRGPGGVESVEGYGLGVVASDFNGDGAIDLFVANDTMPDRLWQNSGGAVFEESGFNWSCDRDNSGLSKAGMGVAVADINDDGAPDLLVCNIKGETDSLYLNAGSHFQDVTSRAGLSGSSFGYTRFGLGLMDFNNDERLDYFAANGAVLADPGVVDGDPYAQRNLLLQGRPDQLGFKPVDGMGGLDLLVPQTSRGAIFSDLDNDGGVDILVLNRNAPARLLVNTVKDRGNWILVDVRNRAGAPGLGARVEIELGDRTRTGFVRTDSSYMTASDPRVHFGLGNLTHIPRIKVIWPDGSSESRENVESNTIIRIQQPEGS